MFSGPCSMFSGQCSMFAGPFLCLLGHVLCLLGHILCLLGHVLCLLSHFLCLLGYVLCLLGHVLCLLGHTLCLLGCVLCLQGHVLCLLDHVLCLHGHFYVCWACPMFAEPSSMFAETCSMFSGHVLCLLDHVLWLLGHVLFFLVMFYVCWAMFYFVGPCSMFRHLRLRSNITDEIYVPKVYHHDYLEKWLIIQCSLLPVKTCFFVTIYLYLMLLFVWSLVFYIYSTTTVWNLLTKRATSSLVSFFISPEVLYVVYATLKSGRYDPLIPRGGYVQFLSFLVNELAHSLTRSLFHRLLIHSFFYLFNCSHIYLLFSSFECSFARSCMRPFLQFSARYSSFIYFVPLSFVLK